ncbi:hypothetical protein LGK95_20130 [Clostridium algoriphilum]|uniref:hypothetical protein n=1 Tax=Clostridium algoriphilum TaxID=198347 RepID=UPI001CF3D01A|nr:hypothetical protein [Clostridium algoriphilum]MCB2295787.1 hypothetical protein [Clostridium algoriphilum]
MGKLKTFQTDMRKSNKIYSISKYDLDPFVTVEFAILPTDNTKKLFSEIWCKYDQNTYCSIVDFQEIIKERDDFYSELNIIRFMSFGVYEVEKGEEIFIQYPVIVEIFKKPYGIKIKFHNKFKEYFDKFLEL